MVTEDCISYKTIASSASPTVMHSDKYCDAAQEGTYRITTLNGLTLAQCNTECHLKAECAEFSYGIAASAFN